MIEIRHLNKSYKTHQGEMTIALKDVDLTIASGEFVSLVGPSGCGKTTLLKILAGLDPSFEGHVSVNGHPVVKPTADIGMVFQDPILLPWRTIIENILLPVELHGLEREFYTDRAMELMNMMGLKGVDNKFPSELSGGMRQRAGICRALIRDPQVLLMDEPFAALDAMTRDFLNEELQRIWMSSGKTIIFVTHSIPESVFLSDRVVIMSPRPGCIADIVSVKLARERKRRDLASDEANDILFRIRDHFTLHPQ